MSLDQFLRRWMGQRGDCCAMAAEWVALVRGFDPDMPRSPAILRAWLADPVAMWQPRLREMARVTEAQRGDVGIVVHEGDAQGAVALGGGLWAAPGLRGVGLHRPSLVLAAWGVGYAGL
jgi:hypothetical protein